VKNKAGTRPHGLTAGSPATMNRAHSDRSMRPNSTKRKANQSQRLTGKDHHRKVGPCLLVLDEKSSLASSLQMIRRCNSLKQHPRNWSSLAHCNQCVSVLQSSGFVEQPDKCSTRAAVPKPWAHTD